MQLYRCDWLNDTQRTSISCALNSMQEKSLFMGLSDMPLIRGIESLNNETNIGGNKSRRSSSIILETLSDLGSSVSGTSAANSIRVLNIDTKHDTRVVNEAFQVN